MEQKPPTESRSVPAINRALISDCFRALAARWRPPMREPEPGDFIKGRIGHFDGMLVAAYLLPASCITMLSYGGIKEVMGGEGLTTFQKVEAATLALGSGVTSFTAYALLGGMVPYFSERRKVLGVCIACALILAVQVGNANFAATSLGGEQASSISMNRTIEQYTLLGDTAYGRVLKAKSFLPSCRAQQERHVLAEEQEKKGYYTGSASPGKVSATHANVASFIKSLCDGTEHSLTEATAIEANIRTELSAMRGAADSPGSLRSRIARVKAGAGKIDGLLVRLQQQDYASPIRRTIDNLSTLVAPLSNAKSGFSKVQDDQLASIAQGLKATGQSFENAAKEIGEAMPLPNKRHRPSPPHIAVIEEFSRIPIVWLTAGLLDSLPTLLALLMLLAHSQWKAERNTKGKGGRK